MSRRQFIALLDENLDLDFVEGPFGDFGVKLVVGQTLQVAGDKVRIQTEVATTMDKVRGLEAFLILDNDVKDIVMGVCLHQRVAEKMTQISRFWICRILEY